MNVFMYVHVFMYAGVEISSDLGMSAHIDQVLASCASSMYALRVLRCHGLPPPQLHEVARATTIASLMYASLSWWGFSSAKDRSRMERLINKLKRSGFLLGMYRLSIRYPVSAGYLTIWYYPDPVK